MLSIFSYVSGPSVCLPWRSVCSSLCPFFNWVVCLPGVESCEFFIYFGDQALVWGIIGKYVFPYSWFSFHFNAVFFSPAEAFYFDEVPFVYSFLYVPCFRGCCCVECLRSSCLVSAILDERMASYGFTSHFLLLVKNEQFYLCFFSLCPILIDSRDLGLLLGSMFCSIGLRACFYASTRLF